MNGSLGISGLGCKFSAFEENESEGKDQFLSRVSILTRDIDIANLSVRNFSVSDENGLTYLHSFFTIR